MVNLARSADTLTRSTLTSRSAIPVVDLAGVLGIIRVTLRAVRLTALAVASLLCRIKHVLTVGSKKEMVGVHTGTYVAMVKDPESIRNRSSVKLPGEPMSTDGSLVADSESAIASIECACGPEPTASERFGFVLRLESLKESVFPHTAPYLEAVTHIGAI